VRFVRFVFFSTTNEGGSQAFEKKSRKTSEHDLEVAKARYSELLRVRTTQKER